MKFGVVVFPGSNCDRDMIGAIKDHLKKEVVILWHKDSDLSMFKQEDCIVLPGGFSYGDYLRCGAIARFSPMMKSVTKFAEDGGKVLGVCNGFQILCESGLLPGVLLRNSQQKFICRNVYLRSVLTGERLQIPIAHGEGRYYLPESQLEGLFKNKQVLYQYCDEENRVNAEANPNGSLENIAAIRNTGGNVIGMMPHPERACDPALGNTDGLKLFRSLFQPEHATINTV